MQNIVKNLSFLRACQTTQIDVRSDGENVLWSELADNVINLANDVLVLLRLYTKAK